MNPAFSGKKIIANFMQVMDIAIQASTHAHAGIQEVNGSLRYFSGSEFSFFNGVFNNYQHQDIFIKDNLTEMTRYFAEKKVPFVWWWMQDTDMPHEMKQELDEKGFQFLGDFAGIAVELSQTNTTMLVADPAIKIKQVETIQEYQKAIAILCDVFQLSDNIKKDLEDMFKSYGPGGKFTHYLGFYQDEPVATATSYIDGDTVGLYNGATLPIARNKGLCSILARSVIDDAIQAGCKYGIAQLMASAMAKGIAEKVGSKKYCTLLPFLKEPN